MQKSLARWLRRAAALPVVLLAAAWLAPLAGTLAGAQEGPPANALVVPLTSKTTHLSLTEKDSRILQLKTRLKGVYRFDPSVVGVTTVNSPNQIHVTALEPGITTLEIVDEKEDSYAVEIIVGGDVKYLEGLIRKTFPDSSVTATKIKGNVMLTGWVNQADQLMPILDIAQQFHPTVINYLRVSGVQQVMLQVKIMEVQRSKIRALGFNFLNLRDASYVASTVGALSPLTSLTAPYGGPVTGALNLSAGSTTPPTAALGLVTNDNIFQGFLEAMKTEQLLKILAEPNLVATNGRPASFLSGGQFPVPIPQGLGTVSVQFKDFGVQLAFVPVVLGNGRIRLDVQPKVSEQDFTNTITVQGIRVPGLKSREVNTQVEMSFGQTLIIAGLLSNRVQSTAQKVPFLGELPWIGAAFRRISHDESETELLIMVTPEPVSPLDDVPPYGPGSGTVSPTDRELFGNGFLETVRYASDPDGAYCPDPASGIQQAGYVPPGPAMPAGSLPPPLPPPLPPESRLDIQPDSTPRATTRPYNLPPATGDIPTAAPETGANGSGGSARSVEGAGLFNNIARRPTQTRNSANPTSLRTPSKPGPIEPKPGAIKPAAEKSAATRPGPIAPPGG